jgi:predicted Rossmann-fold nucleotide-binding protein
VLLDVDNFWAPFGALLDQAVEAGFLRPAHRRLANEAGSVAEALALLEEPPPPPVHKWIDRDDT